MQKVLAEWREKWRILVCAVIGVTASVSYVFGLGVLVPHIHAETGWSRAQISAGLLVGATVLALVSPVTGRLVDRGHTRACAMGGFVIYGLGLAAVGMAPVPFLPWLVLWAATAVGAGLCCLTLWTTLITRWFHEGRGITLAVVMSGSGLSAVIAPLAASALAAWLGWREALAVMGLAIVAICLPLCAAWLHDAPAAQEAGSQGEGQNAGGPAIFGLSLLKLCALAFMLTGTLTGMSVHFPLILAQAGASAARAAQLTGLIGLGVIVGRFAIGALLDKFSGALVGALAMAGPAVATLLLFDAAVGQSLGGLVAAALIGFALGTVSLVLAVVTGQLYRADSFGSALGVVIGCMSVSSGIGPVIAGRVYDRTGDYSAFLMGAGAVFVLAMLIFLSLGRAIRQRGRPGQAGMEGDGA